MISPASHTKPSTDSQLLGLLVAAFYALLTLLPDSSSLVVSWGWVAVWQIGLLCPVLWLLSIIWQQRRIPLLGNGLDWVAGFFLVSLIASTAFAAYPNQARWYSWAAICGLAALYAVNSWLRSPQRRYQLLTWQGYLSLAFIALSLLLWVSQTLFPELAQLQEFRQYGVNLPFDFSTLELRNWAPIGHQNYVAGYLVLTLPLLIGLGMLRSDRQRWLWFAGAGLGLVDLYTTSSRGGWLGLVVVLIVGFGLLLWQSAIPQRWLMLSSGGVLALLILLVLANNRLRTLITAVLSGQVAGGELGYRLITATAGWEIGRSQPILGTGLGSVPLLYQQYRPAWAGREAELVYQLHSTPIQVWAELGLLGVLSMVAAIVLLLYLSRRWLKQSTDALSESKQDRVIVWSLGAGLVAYGITSLTDYQLDIIAISGAIVIYLATLASIFRTQTNEKSHDVVAAYSLSLAPSHATVFALFSVGILLAVIVWLVPIHRAWMLSSQGFQTLNQLANITDPQQRQTALTTFTQKLDRAHQLAPWEPYYPYQLGWNLGNLAVQATTPQQPEWLQGSLNWLQVGTEIAPNQEFGYTNAAWLLLDLDPKAATQAFTRAIQLVPAKRSLFLGLGLSLLRQGKPDLAVEAVSLEMLRDPLLITSPVWRSPELKPLYTQAVQRLEAKYATLLAQHTQPDLLNYYLHQCRGALHWWMGDLPVARTYWDKTGQPLSQAVLQITEGKTVSADPQADTALPGVLAIAAWQNPSDRATWLQRAWIKANQTLPPEEFLQQLVTSMNRSTTFEQWLKQNAPTRSYRRDRVGFGVLSRHIDGPAPSDFLIVVDNVAMSYFFNDLFPSWEYFREIDFAIQSQKNALLEAVNS
jgi:uncharacterized protein involved in response to NO